LHRVNHRIRVPEVRVVLDDGTQLGVLSRDEALREAQERGLDLVEISPRAQPPVCRIMDYGRFKYEQSKKQKAAKKHATSMELKEIKFRPKTEQHDMDFKLKHVRRFLEEGNKVRLVIVFRGREITHPKTGLAVLDRVVKVCEDIATVEVKPNLEGKRMIMILGPRAGVVKRAKSAQQQKSADKPQDTDGDKGEGDKGEAPAAERGESPAADRAETPPPEASQPAE
jgi:translation initiation factor IF-3